MPTSYNAIPDSMVDAESPVTVNLMTYLRDNPIAITEGAAGAPQVQSGAIASGAVSNGKLAVDSVSAAKIQAGAVTLAKIAAGAVTQPKVSTGTDSKTAAPTVLDQTGWWEFSSAGEYGFFPFTDASHTFDIFIANELSHTTTKTTLSWRNRYSGTNDIDATIRYVTASPPYDLGDGDVPLFMFVGLVDGRPLNLSTCMDPPWAGHEIQPHYERSGKKFRLERQLPFSYAKALQSPEFLEQYLDALRNAPLAEVEVTKAFKNKSMHLRPHPFVDRKDYTVLMLDPMSPVVAQLAELHAQGEKVNHLILRGYVEFGNDAMPRACPPGVMPVSAKWRNSRG
jgi:hypothetical protein